MLVLMAFVCGFVVYVALHLSDKHPEVFRGVIVENTFTCIDDMIETVLKPLRHVKWLSTNKWRNMDIAGRLRLPVLWISGRKDDLVPPAHMTTLHECANRSPKNEIFEMPTGMYPLLCN